TMACAPEPQTRLTVRAGVVTGSPAWTAACRAGFILVPAWTTLPMTTVSTSSGRIFARVTAAAIATEPRAGAGTSLSEPPKVPIAVRTGSAKTTERCDVMANLLRVRSSPALRKQRTRARRTVGRAQRGSKGGRQIHGAILDAERRLGSTCRRANRSTDPTWFSPFNHQIGPNRGAISCRRRSGCHSRVDCCKRREPSDPRRPQARSPRRLQGPHSRRSELDRRRGESRHTPQTTPTVPKVRTVL